MRRFIGVLLCICLLASTVACGQATPAASAATSSGGGGAPAGLPPASATAAAGTTSPSAATSPAVTTPAPTAAAAAKDDDIAWHQGGIGHPLTSDDPRAKDKKVVMLTFDDGPSEEATAQVLDTLKAEKIRAVFFVTGYGAKHTELLERIHREGHLIGTHTMTHRNLTRLDREGMTREIVPVNETVERVTGRKPRYFRPPFGAYNDALLALMKELDMELINWSAGSLDWQLTDPDKIVTQVLDTVHPGAIMLFHDTHKHTAEALPAVIKGLRDRGYEFVVLR